jgi:hypothetical protein
MSDTAIATVGIGLFAGFIALRQWLTARAKFKLDMFEHRYALYELLWSYMSQQVQDGEQIRDKHVELQNSMPKFYFLFGPEVGDFASEALKHGIDFHTAKQIGKNPKDGEALAKANADITAGYQWFGIEANRLRERFGKYMQFDRWH